MLLETFQIWNSVISSFQCEIKGGGGGGGIRTTPNVGAIPIGQK